MRQSVHLATDYQSSRAYDRDGRLHVSGANISKSNVCGYFGYEIPHHVELGLDPNRLYNLWRHPAELEKAARTFNNMPLLAKHVPADANDHRPDDVVGATGSEGRFIAPYLKNSLVVWAGPSIRAVEDGSQRELSCGYRYRAEIRRGVTPAGEAYDGVMTTIEGSHLALVERGRAGPDVMIGDAVARRSMREMFSHFQG